QQGLFRLADHGGQLLHVAHVWLGELQVVGGPLNQRAQTALGGVLLPGQGGELGGLGGDVLDDIDEHRAGTAAPGDGEGLADNVGQLVDVPDHVVALGNRHGDAGNIDLLEGVLADEVLTDVARHKYHRRGIHIGRSDAGSQVGAAGTRGSEADADLAGGAGIAVGGVGRAQLVGRENM